MIPGRFYEFWAWLDAQVDKGRFTLASTSRSLGRASTTEGTVYQCVISEVRSLGYKRETPVIRVGTWGQNGQAWPYDIQYRYPNVTEEDY